MSSTVRPASARDWEAIAALLDQHRLPRAGATEHVSDFMVAVDDGRVIGVAGLEMYGAVALLRSVAVASPGGGIGTRLVQALLDHASQAGVSTVVLLTTTAARFFPRFGFSVVNREDVPAAVHASAEFLGASPTENHPVVREVVEDWLGRLGRMTPIERDRILNRQAEDADDLALDCIAAPAGRGIAQ